MISVPTINPNVERQVRLFEEALASSDSARFTEFLIDETHEDYTRVAVELMRVDLELSWERGQRKGVRDYINILPKLVDNPAVRSDLAFEEYRARIEQGEKADPTEYETKHQIDTSTWPLKAITPNSDAAERVSTTPDSFISSGAAVGPGIGTRWGPFDIVDELGRGSLARTYLANQPELGNRSVALKFTRTITTEADKLARLQHTNIVPVYSIHEDDEWLVTCMPYLGRTTLADVVANPGLLHEVEQQYGSDRRERSILRLVQSIASGLEHAHARGILHRDIKPANILLSDEGEPMLLDFNLAVDRDRIDSSALTGGTVPYMSPEQLRRYEGTNGSDTQPDERSDVYSIGVVLHQLLTGSLPWNVDQANVDGNFASILAERIKSRQLSIAGSSAANEIVGRCLAPTPAVRYQSAAEVVTDIERHLNDQPLKYARNASCARRRQNGCDVIRGFVP